MQIICSLLQTDNHATTSPLSFYRPDALPAAQPTASKHWRYNQTISFNGNQTFQNDTPPQYYVKVKAFPYSIPSIGSGADPSVQAVSLQVTISHTPRSRLPLLSARPAVTSPATEHHRPLASTKLYCLVTEAHRCKQTCLRLLYSIALKVICNDFLVAKVNCWSHALI